MTQNIATILSTVNGASFISLDTVTDVKLTGGRKNPMQGRVTKRVTGSSVMVFTNKNSNGYANMVERRLMQEGKDPQSFQLGQRQWGTRIENEPFVRHEKDGQLKFYLEVIFLKAGKTEYLLDGEPIAKDAIEGLPEAKDNDEGQGGLENKVIVRSYAVDSIVAIRVNKDEYKGPFYYA